MSDDLSGLTIAELKEQSRDIATRLEFENESQSKPTICKTCKRRMTFGGECNECLDAELEKTNRELGSRNAIKRATLSASEYEDEPAEDDDADESIDEAPKPAQPNRSTKQCEVCGDSLRGNNTTGICGRNPKCRAAYQRRRMAAKRVTKPVRRASPKPKPAAESPVSVVPADLDLLRVLQWLRERAAKMSELADEIETIFVRGGGP